MQHAQYNSAHNLFFNSDLSKTQIAEMLGISRQTFYLWCKQGSWDSLKKTAKHMPSLIAEKCYHIMNDLADHILGVKRRYDPITPKEVETFHKLTLTINKLKNKSTVNEKMETFSSFMDTIKDDQPDLAAQIHPLIESYLAKQASLTSDHLLIPEFNSIGRMDDSPSLYQQKVDEEEARLDLRDERIVTNADERHRLHEETIVADNERRYQEYLKRLAEEAEAKKLLQDSHGEFTEPHGESIEPQTESQTTENTADAQSVEDKFVFSDDLLAAEEQIKDFGHILSVPKTTTHKNANLLSRLQKPTKNNNNLKNPPPHEAAA